MLTESDSITTELSEVIGRYPEKFKDIFIQKFIELNRRTLSEDIESYEELRDNAEELRELNKTFVLILSDNICRKILRQLSLRGACTTKTFYNKIKDFNTNDPKFKQKKRNLNDKIRDVCSSLLELEVIEKETLNIKPFKAIVYKSPAATPVQVEVAKEFYDEWAVQSDEDYIKRKADLEAQVKILASEKLKAYWEAKKGTTEEMIKDAVTSEKKKAIKSKISNTIKETIKLQKKQTILTCACEFKGSQKELGDHWASKQVIKHNVSYCKECDKKWESPKPCVHNCQVIFNFNSLEETWVGLNQILDDVIPNLLKSQNLGGLLKEGKQ